MEQKVKTIAVIGAQQATDEQVDAARELGREISGRGYHLVCGGGGGVMEAACLGFRQGRNELSPIRLCAVGIIPGDDPQEANPYVDVCIPTGMGLMRNALVVRSAHAVVAVGGGSGTLSEIALAWQLGKKVVALGTTGGWAAQLAGKALDDRRTDVVYAVDYPDQAMDLIEHGFDRTMDLIEQWI